MENIQTTMLVIHTLIALGIIALVLLQRGKGADAGAAFGAGASGTVFGAQGSTNFFSRTTAVLATAFFATSLSLAYISSQRSGAPESVLENAPAVETGQVAPAAAPAEELVPDLPELDEAAPAADDTGMPALENEDVAAETPTEE
jgi:preprotein translocase subunit SecG